VTANPLLDLNVGIRYDSFLFQLLTQDHSSVIGTLDVDLSQPPTVSVDTARTTFRTCTGLRVSAADLSAIDVRHDRVRPILRLQDGSEESLGVFMFGTDNKAPFSGWETWTPDLFDETWILNQPVPSTVSLSAGGSALSLFIAIVQAVGLPVVEITGVTDATVSTAVTWRAGTLATKILNDLAGILACYPPFFANSGAYRLKPSSPPGSPSDHVYELGGRIFYGSEILTNSAYQAPNRYTVTSTDTLGNTIVGVFDLPPEAPNSYANTGTRVVKDEPITGIASQELADLAAYVDALTDQKTSYIQGTFNSAADPRHDVWDLVQLRGKQYQETGWSIVCKAGAPMNHQLIGFY
jgi:hypothetical protein